MLADLSKSLRLSLVLVLGSAAAAFPIIDATPAWADEDDEDEDDDDDDEDKDDDDDEGEEEEEEEEEADPDQPLVTAGNLFTLKSYPQGEIQRPLTMTIGITELKVGLGFDISNKTAFETFGASFDARYGLQDNVELQAGFYNIQNFDNYGFYGAFEGSIVYDLVDFRTGIKLDHIPGTTTFGIPVGFPFRYAPKEQVAVVALEEAFEIQFDSKPDAVPNIGIVVQPAPIVAILIKGGLRVPDFDFSDTGTLTVPGSIAVQLSPNNRIDAGLEFRFPNLKPKEGEPKFYEQRFLLFFGQIRI